MNEISVINQRRAAIGICPCKSDIYYFPAPVQALAALIDAGLMLILCKLDACFRRRLSIVRQLEIANNEFRYHPHISGQKKQERDEHANLCK